MKKIFILISLSLILFACNQSSLNESDLVFLKITNNYLEHNVEDSFNEYMIVSNYSDDNVKEFVDSCSHFINDLKNDNLNTTRFNEINDWLKDKNVFKINNWSDRLVETELGRQLCINRILTYELSFIMYFKKLKMSSYFQTNMFKLVSMKDTIPYGKSIPLLIETKYASSNERAKIVYHGDTIVEKENVFEIEYTNPKKGKNVLITPFIYKKWGEVQVFDSVKVEFFVE